jgi:hypothetical protein
VTHHVIVEVPFNAPPLPPILLSAQNATDAVDQAQQRHTNSDSTGLSCTPFRRLANSCS